MKLNILHVVATPFPANQGTAAAVKELINALVKMGHEIHIVTYYQGEDTPIPGVYIHRIPSLGGRRNESFVGFTKKRPLLDLALALKTLQVVRRVRPHVIHAHHHEGVMAAFLSRIISKIPLIYHCVASMEQELPLFVRPSFLLQRIGKLLDTFVPRLADYCVALSPDLVDNIGMTGFPPEKTFYLPMVVDTSLFREGSGEKFRDRYRLANNNIILYTGVVDEFQGLGNLLKSMTIVTKEVPSAKLIIAATIFNVNQIKKYRALVQELGLENFVMFLEDFPFSELPNLLAVADVTVIPREKCPGFPMKLLNYMAAGKPIVSMRGSAKILREGKNGLIADTWEELGEKILVLLKDKDLSQRLGRAGKLELDRFAPDVVAEKMERVYISLVRHNNF